MAIPGAYLEFLTSEFKFKYLPVEQSDEQFIMNEIPVTLVYHGSCQDGVAALTIFQYFLKTAFPKIPVKVVYGRYQENVDIEQFRGTDVYILDFSYKREVMEKILEVAFAVTLLDHHKSAILDLEPILDKLGNYTDTSKCGAMLTWDYVYTGKPYPRFLQLVNERDMWQKTNKDADALTLAIQTTAPREYQKIELFTKLIEDTDELFLNELLNKGHAFLEYNSSIVEQLAGKAYDKTIVDHLGQTKTVKMCNCPQMFASEVGGLLASKNIPDGISICWVEYGDLVKYSVRVSETVDWDAGKYAALFGGGGHVRAAGYSIKVDD